MEPMYYISLDVHKRKLSYRVKDRAGFTPKGTLPATRIAAISVRLRKREQANGPGMTRPCLSACGGQGQYVDWYKM